MGIGKKGKSETENPRQTIMGAATGGTLSDSQSTKKRAIGQLTGETLDAPANNPSSFANSQNAAVATFSNQPVIPDPNMAKWLNEKEWKRPEWLKRNQSSKAEAGYRNYYLNTLRARYMRLEDDFRTVYNNFYNTKYMDLVTARRIIAHLLSAKDILEDDDCDINDAITSLDLVEQYLVWLYPPHVAKARAYSLAAELRAKKSIWADYLLQEINRNSLDGMRASLDKVIESINKANQETLVSGGLQIQRLNSARNWSAIVLALSLLFVPILINFDTNADPNGAGNIWSKTFLDRFAANFRPWVVTICMAIFGAGGAFFSSLLSVRTTRTALTDFQENLKNNQLKFFIGAIAAVILFTFLTWQIVPGVELKNAGSFIFLAFIAGFSERFFLNLLNIDESSDMAPRPATPPNIMATATPVGGLLSEPLMLEKAVPPPAPEVVEPELSNKELMEDEDEESVEEEQTTETEAKAADDELTKP